MKKILFGLACAFIQTVSAQTVTSSVYPVTTDLSDPRRPARTPEKGNAFRKGLTDALFHIDPGFDGEKLPKLLGAERVRRVVVMPVPNEGLSKVAIDGTAQKIQLAQNHPQKIKVMCGGDYLSNWLAEAQRYGAGELAVQEKFRRLEADLDSGMCLGIGEFGLLHFNKLGNQNVIHNRYDDPLVLKMIDIVGTRAAWIQLHAEPREPNGRSRENELWATLQTWTQRYPQLKIMLSHTGMTSAANARRILETFPTVYMSIKLMSSKEKSWAHLEPVLNEEGSLYEDWAQLMEAMPERFVIGSDAKFGQSGHEGAGEAAYELMIRRFRRMLGSLAPQAAKLIATKNAEQLYGFKQNAEEDASTQ